MGGGGCRRQQRRRRARHLQGFGPRYGRKYSDHPAFSGLADPNGTWTLRLRDAVAPDVGTVTGASLAINDTPAMAVNDTATVSEDSDANTINVRQNDTDPDASTDLIADKSNGTHGTVAITNNGDDLTYTPDANYCGADSFTYKLNDAANGTATVSVTVTCVDDAAMAVNDTATVSEDSGANTINVRQNDTDPDASTDLIADKSNGTHGTVAITNNGDDLTYTPDANYCGADSFTYKLNDAANGTATVSVTVTCVDDNPIAVNDTKTVNEDAGATTINVSPTTPTSMAARSRSPRSQTAPTAPSRSPTPAPT